MRIKLYGKSEEILTSCGVAKTFPTDPNEILLR